MYAASKAALNQALRHMAAELERRGSQTKVLALHPGEVATDMAANDLSYDLPEQMGVEESVGKCIKTIEERGDGESGTFWTWEGKVSQGDIAKSKILLTLAAALSLVGSRT